MSVSRNIISLLVSQLATWSVTLLLLVSAPDRLGQTGYGNLSYATAFVGFFGLIASLGTGNVLTRAIARDESVMRSYVGNAVAVKAVMIVVLAALAMLVAVLLQNDGEVLLLIAIGLVGMAFMTYTEVLAGALAGIQFMAKPAALGVVQVYVASLSGLLVLVLGWGVIPYAFAFAAATAIPAVGNAVLLRSRLRGPAGHLDRSVQRMLVRAGIPLMILAFFNTIYGTIDIPIIGAVSGQETVAWYALAYRWVGIPIFIAGAVVSAYFPLLSAHGKDPDGHEFTGLVNKAVRIVLLASLPAAVGLTMVADDLIGYFYSPAYEPTVVLMQILALHIPIAGMDTVLAVSLIASDRQNKYLWVAGIAALTNPFVAWVLIRWADRVHDNGAIGAALATFGTELFILIGAMLLRARGVLRGRAAFDCLRIVAASVLMVPVLLLTQSLHLFVQIVIGMVTYVVAAVLLRAVKPEELRDVLGRLRRRVGRDRRGRAPVG